MQFDINLFTIVVSVVTIVISLTVHEFMHAYTGLKLGDTTAHDEGRVSFNPMRHIDPLTTVALPIITLILFHAPILAAKPVPFQPDRVKYDEFGGALIAAAGPFSNLFLAFLGVLGMSLMRNGGAVFDALTIFSVINVGLFVFNMIPIPPLDGSRVLYAFAPEPLQEIMAGLETIGLFIIFGLVLAVPGFGDLLISLNSTVIQFLLDLFNL